MVWREGTAERLSPESVSRLYFSPATRDVDENLGEESPPLPPRSRQELAVPAGVTGETGSDKPPPFPPSFRKQSLVANDVTAPGRRIRSLQGQGATQATVQRSSAARSVMAEEGCSRSGFSLRETVSSAAAPSEVQATVAEVERIMVLHDGQGLKAYLDGAARDVGVWRKTAENGAPDAQYLLGLCYWQGSGVPQNMKVMVEWLRKAADQGYVLAQNHLASCYYNAPGPLVSGWTLANSGQDISRDHVEAVRWWLKAADQGYALAQYSLGTCFYKGDGVPQDREEGLRWIRKAAEQHEPNAVNYLIEISEPITRSVKVFFLVAVGTILFCGSLWFVGTYHIVSSSKNGTMVIPKAIFTFKETFVSVDEITGMPYIVAQTRWPLAIQALQREGILESDDARRQRIGF